MYTVKYILMLLALLMASVASASSHRGSYSFIDNVSLNDSNSEFEELSFSPSNNHSIHSVELHFPSSRVRSRLNSSLLLPEQQLPFTLPASFNSSFDIEHHDIIPVTQRLGTVLEIAELQTDFSARDVISNIRNNDAFRRDHLHPVPESMRPSLYVVTNKTSVESVKGEPCKLVQVDNDQHILDIKNTTIEEIENIALIEEEVAYNAISYELPAANITTFASLNLLSNQLETRLSNNNSFFDSQAGYVAVAAGDEIVEKHGLWAGGATGFMKQGKTQAVDAFKSRSHNVTIGVDTLLNEGHLLGMAYGINKIFNKFDSSASREKVDLRTLTFYFENNKLPVIFFYSLTLGELKIKNSRDLIYNNKLVISKHTGDALHLQASGSYNYVFNTAFITPRLSLNSSHLKIDGFQENGVSILESFDQKLAIHPSVTIGKVIPVEYSSFIPSIRYGVEICASHKQKKPNIFIISTHESLIATKSKEPIVSHKIGATLELINAATKLSIGYDFIFQKKNRFHSVTASLKYQF